MCGFGMAAMGSSLSRSTKVPSPLYAAASSQEALILCEKGRSHNATRPRSPLLLPDPDRFSAPFSWFVVFSGPASRCTGREQVIGGQNAGVDHSACCG